MSLDQLTTIEAIPPFLDGTQAAVFSIATNKQEHYRRVQKTLIKHQYILPNRADKGVIMCYFIKVLADSPAQTRRLIRQYVETGEVTVKLLAAMALNGLVRMRLSVNN